MPNRHTSSPPTLRHSDLYDEDFVAWTEHTAALLRAARFNEVDAEHAAEEIEDMGKRDLKELNSRLQVLIMHLLKWHLQPRQRSASWRTTIVTQRLEISALLESSPSLRHRLSDRQVSHYDGAVKRAVAETGFKRSRFPAVCPYTIEQMLDDEFLPR